MSETPNARLDWQTGVDGRKIGLVNGFVVYTVKASRNGEYAIFHRLPVTPIDKTFKTSDEAKLYADTHLHRAMRALGFVEKS